MKWFLIFWAGPIVFLGGWYWLSYYDMSFGIFMLSRQVHDLTFELYGKALGIPPETIPPLVARAIAVDSLVVFAILGLPEAQVDHRLVEGASGVEFVSIRPCQQGKPVERALKDEACRGRIDPFGPLGARDVHFEQRPFSRNRRKPLIPIDEGQRRLLLHVAHEGARRLHARTRRSVHVHRQADDEACDLFHCGESPAAPEHRW